MRSVAGRNVGVVGALMGRPAVGYDAVSSKLVAFGGLPECSQVFFG